MECSGIDIDQSFIHDNQFAALAEYEEEGNRWSETQNHKPKRSYDETSPNETVVPKYRKLEETAAKVANIVFIKGVNKNLTKENPLQIKRALLNIHKSLTDDQIQYSKESLKIKCRDENQKTNF